MNGYIARTLEEALTFHTAGKMTPYAGGTALVGARQDTQFLFINNVTELKAIWSDDRYIRIGAAATLADSLRGGLLPPLLVAAIHKIGTPAIRNAGTFGGNLACGRGDIALVLQALGGEVRLLSLRGERILPAAQLRHALLEDELIAEILLPKEQPDQFIYEKVGGREPAKAAFIGAVRWDGQDRICRFVAAFGAPPITLRFPELEDRLLGKTRDEAAVLQETILDLFQAELEHVDGPGWYQKTVWPRMLEDGLKKLFHMT